MLKYMKEYFMVVVCTVAMVTVIMMAVSTMASNSNRSKLYEECVAADVSYHLCYEYYYSN